MSQPSGGAVSPERIAQIAGRKLTALGVPHGAALTLGVLEGVWAFTPGRLLNPVTGLPIGRSRFVTVSHDRLRFVEPPLAVLAPFSFYDANTMADLEGPIAAALQQRGDVLKQLAARFEALRLRTRTDPDELMVLGELALPEARILIEGGPNGVRIRALHAEGATLAVGEHYPPLDLNDFPAPVDLELHLSDALPAIGRAAREGAQAQAAQSRGPGRASIQLEPAPLPAGTLTLGELAQSLGPGAVLVPGERLEVAQEFMAGGVRYRFVATHEAGPSFRARLTGPRGILWQDRIHLARFPGMPAFVARTLGVPVAASAPSAPAPAAPAASQAPSPAPAAPAASASAGGHELQAHPGEVWVMNVVVQADPPGANSGEVRYLCVDANGQHYGAPRLLPRAEFERLFEPHGGGWRLPILIEKVEGDSITYRPLERGRRPGAQAKALPRAVLVTTFLPEAAAY